MSFYVYLKGNYQDGEIVSAPNFIAAKFCFSQKRRVEQSTVAAEKRRD